MRSRALPVALAAIVLVLIVIGVIFLRNQPQLATTTESPAPEAVEAATGAPGPTGETAVTGAPEGAATEGAVATTGETKGNSMATPDLSIDPSGLSKATVVLNTTAGVIKYKFYPKDAPNTVARMIELIQQGFYNGLTFHRVVPGFVIQGGDPIGNGTGGSGKKLKAEFNNRPHIEGTVAMARAADPDSADSQFYIALGTHPHLDRNYTVFGQVVEGNDVAKRIKVGDKISSATIE